MLQEGEGGCVETQKLPSDVCSCSYLSPKITVCLVPSTAAGSFADATHAHKMMQSVYHFSFTSYIMIICCVTEHMVLCVCFLGIRS